jgi:hypothetical protein
LVVVDVCDASLNDSKGATKFLKSLRMKARLECLVVSTSEIIVTHVIADESVATIRQNDFSNCGQLVSVIMGDGVTSIESVGFLLL